MNETIKQFTQQPLNIASEELVNKLGFQCVPTLGNVAIDDFFRQNDFTYRYLNDIKEHMNTALNNIVHSIVEESLDEE